MQVLMVLLGDENRELDGPVICGGSKIQMPLGMLVELWGKDAILKCEFERGQGGKPDKYFAAIVKP